jgi:hypothetical protein
MELQNMFLAAFPILIFLPSKLRSAAQFPVASDQEPCELSIQTQSSPPVLTSNSSLAASGLYQEWQRNVG